jgi:Putative peptidoglycan binding domain
MRNKLLVSTAVLAAAIAAAACEKTPSEEPNANQSGPSISERQRGTEEAVQQTQPSDAQQHSTQTANQPAAGGNEQQSKEGQREQEAGIAQDREDNQERSNSSRGQTSRQDLASGPSQSSVQSDRDALAGQAQQTEPQQKQPQLAEQNRQTGPNQRASGTGGGGALNLGRDQIRQVQMVLKEKGFEAGEADGVLGPRTRKALIAFQRQQGLEPSGEIDQRTATALGISKGLGSTTGHSGAGAQ